MKMHAILVATDFSELSQAALKLASSLASDTGARLLIAHVETPESIYGGDELDLLVHPVDASVAQHRLKRVHPTVENVPFETHLLTGVPATEIVRFATEHQVDLIVIGTHGRTGPMRLLLGSVAESIVRHATCPVLSVKAQHAQLPEPEHEQ